MRNETPQVIQAGVFILRSALKVTQRVQRVPPACIIKQQMPRTVTDPSVGTFRVRVGSVGRRWFVEPRHAHGAGAEGAVRAGITVVARTLVTGTARTLNILTGCHWNCHLECLFHTTMEFIRDT